MVTFHWIRHLWLQVPSEIVPEEEDGTPCMTSPHEEAQEEVEEQGSVNERETLSCFITAWIILVCGLQRPHIQHTFTEALLCAGQLLDTRHRREWSRWVSILKQQTAQISPQAEGFRQGCTWSSTISAGIVSPNLLALLTGVILTQVAVPLWQQDGHPVTGWGHVSSAPNRNLTSLSL